MNKKKKEKIMVEDKIKVMNDLDIQIRDIEEEIQKIKSANEKIKLIIQKKLLLLKQLDAKSDSKES